MICKFLRMSPVDIGYRLFRPVASTPKWTGFTLVHRLGRLKMHAWALRLPYDDSDAMDNPAWTRMKITRGRLFANKKDPLALKRS